MTDREVIAECRDRLLEACNLCLRTDGRDGGRMASEATEVADRLALLLRKHSLCDADRELAEAVLAVAERLLRECWAGEMLLVLYRAAIFAAAAALLALGLYLTFSGG